MERTATYRDFYEYEAGTYAITPEAELAWTFRRLLVHRLLPRDPGPILDVGCGDGALAADLRATTGQPVTGVELSLRRAERVAGRVPVRLVNGSSYELPFRDRSFPLVVCTDLLEHLDDPARAMSELVRVSSRRVLVSVPYCIKIEKTLCPHCGKDYFLYGHQHSFGEDGLRRLAQGAGAQVVRTEHVIPMFECRRYKWFPPLKWLLWDHFKNSGTLGALIERSAS